MLAGGKHTTTNTARINDHLPFYGEKGAKKRGLSPKIVKIFIDK